MFRLLTDDLQWKALSLLIAVALWFLVVGEPELVTTHSTPIFYKDLPRDLEISSDPPDRVHIEIRGPANKLSPSSLAETAVFLDLSSVNGPGERTFTIHDSSINLPSGVTLERAVPSQLRLRFDRVASKQVEVRVRTGAQEPSGYRIVQEEVRPARLTITGPEGSLQQIDSAQTDPIDLSKVVGRAEFHVHAYVTDPQVRFEGSPLVTVTVTVEKTAR
jgi:YbbR domain-containing protein